MAAMNPVCAGVIAGLLCLAALARAENPLPTEKAGVLPLALSDDFEFRKFKIFRNFVVPGATPPPTRDPMIDFERRRRLWGAIDSIDTRQRQGQYFTFMWRSNRVADVVVRLEYRQANLKNYVQARELYYPRSKGNKTTEFAILGDDYELDGPITSWRALLIENNRIVGLLQSRTWR
jgi:hypothetical protein